MEEEFLTRLINSDDDFDEDGAWDDDDTEKEGADDAWGILTDVDLSDNEDWSWLDESFNI